MPTTVETYPQSETYYDELLNEKEAAQFLDFTVRALQNWRVRGGGPAFIKIGTRAVRYRRCDLIEWVNQHRVYHTSMQTR